MMLRRRSATPLLSICVMMTLGTASARADGPPSASGAGTFLYEGELRNFAFNATAHRDGSESGQAQVVNRAQDARGHYEITCLNIIDNRAYMGGYLVLSSEPEEVGLPFIFAVEDNGEGAGSPPDVMTFALFGDPGDIPDCHDPELVDLLDFLLDGGELPGFGLLASPIQGGNIQVRP
jgi:hypothetical protein